MNKKVMHGNKAWIDPIENVIPMNLTNVITPKKTQISNDVPNTIPENAEFGKNFVDENHK